MPQPPAHDVDIYEGWTDTQLVREVKGKYGAEGAGAGAELTKRLKVQLREEAEAASAQAQETARLIKGQARTAAQQGKRLNRLTLWLVVLTLVLTISALIDLIDRFS